ncbi:MAG: hypothetical protein M1392_04835 [Gammaproteobacteria bacterium]|nr:hypothetical protein [Gammaproteobacteria bacterium]
MNKIYLALMIAMLVYIYTSTPPTDIARAFGQVLPLVIIGLTLLADDKKTKSWERAAFFANLLICLLALAIFMSSAISGTFGVVMSSIVFLPFFVNAYFFASKMWEERAAAPPSTWY